MGIYRDISLLSLIFCRIGLPFIQTTIITITSILNYTCYSNRKKRCIVLRLLHKSIFQKIGPDHGILTFSLDLALLYCSCFEQVLPELLKFWNILHFLICRLQTSSTFYNNFFFPSHSKDMDC